MTKILAALLGIIVLAVGVIALAGVGSYNNLVGLEEGVDGAWAQVENVYQRRADLIPNLVETVKGARDFEQDTIIAVTEARAGIGKLELSGTPTPEQLEAFQEAQAGLTSALSRLLVTVERYPQLGATQAFRDLQSQLEGSENRIAVERMRFNDAAKAFNTSRRRFPAALFASAMGFEEKPYFSAIEGAETPPSVDFGE